MKENIHNILFQIFYSSIQRKIVKEYPDNYKAESLVLGKNVGERMADDFFAKNGLYEKIEFQYTPKYIALFFKNYFDLQVEVKSDEVVLNDALGILGGECGMVFLTSVLNTIFAYLNDQIIFEVNGERLMYKIKSI